MALDQARLQRGYEAFSNVYRERGEEPPSFDQFSARFQNAAPPAPAAPPEAAARPVSDVARLAGEAADRHGVDARLVGAVILQESGGRHYADRGRVLTSPAGARGLMQLMPGTARGLGVDPDDLAQNIDGGVRYLRQQLDTFHGDVPKAVAAYNAGPGNVEKYRGIPPFHETINYVRNVMSTYRRVTGETSGGGGQAAVPAPATADFTAPAAEAAPRTRTFTVAGYHAIQRGDTLGAIAARYGSTVQDMADLNQIPDPNRINVGQSLMIPGGQGGPRRQPQRQVTVPLTTGQRFAYGNEAPGTMARDQRARENVDIAVRAAAEAEMPSLGATVAEPYIDAFRDVAAGSGQAGQTAAGAVEWAGNRLGLSPEDWDIVRRVRRNSEDLISVAPQNPTLADKFIMNLPLTNSS